MFRISEFFPQVHDVHVERAGFDACGIEVPELAQDFVAGYDAAAGVDEVTQELGLLFG